MADASMLHSCTVQYCCSQVGTKPSKLKSVAQQLAEHHDAVSKAQVQLTVSSTALHAVSVSLRGTSALTKPEHIISIPIPIAYASSSCSISWKLF